MRLAVPHYITFKTTIINSFHILSANTNSPFHLKPSHSIIELASAG